MATRLYFTNSATPYTPSSWHGSWDVTAGTASINLLDTTKAGARDISGDIVTVANYNCALARFVSAGYSAGTIINGTIGIGYGTETYLGSMITHCHIWVTQGDSNSERGTILTNWDGHNTWGVKETGGRVATGITATEVEFEQGDRIVVEIGYHNTGGGVSYGYGYRGTTLGDITEGSNFYDDGLSGWVDFEISSSAVNSFSALSIAI